MYRSMYVTTDYTYWTPKWMEVKMMVSGKDEVPVK